MTSGPTDRPRRLRRTGALRALVRETRLDVDDLIQPLFVVHGREVRRPSASLPGIHPFSADAALATGADHADGNFTTIGNQDFFEHRWFVGRVTCSVDLVRRIGSLDGANLVDEKLRNTPHATI